MIQFLYPNDPFNPRQPDEQFLEEYTAAEKAGFAIALYSHENLLQGDQAIKATRLPEVTTVIRGWMLTIDGYAKIYNEMASKGAKPISSPDMYRLCHHLPAWYPFLAAYTPDTVTVPETSDYVAAVAAKSWKKYFVKDFVKSLNTGQGSLCSTPQEIAPIVQQIRHYRGDIEGGVCIREVEAFLPETEERYFVYEGKAFGRESPIPSVVEFAAQQIKSHFFCVDTITREDGLVRIIELGDGQVSDRKYWNSNQFIRMFESK